MSDPTGSEKSQQSFPLVIAFACGAIWLAVLLWLTVSFSNPVTLNRAQILNSHAVLLGELHGNEEEIAIEKSWITPFDAESLKLQNLDAASMPPQTGIKYLVPVFVERDRWKITPSPVKDIPLIYPGNDIAIAQLKAILKE